MATGSVTDKLASLATRDGAQATTFWRVMAEAELAVKGLDLPKLEELLRESEETVIVSSRVTEELAEILMGAKAAVRLRELRLVDQTLADEAE